MNLCKTTMKLLAAILFATVTVANIRPIQGAKGAVYVRWGHKRCPSQSELVYSGYAGGSHWTHRGGAAEYLCLPKNPTRSRSSWRSYTEGHAQLWGAEYELGRGHSQEDHDVPCAVCQSSRRMNMIMLPARDICPWGWRREYRGLLMAGRPNERVPSQYVCVDSARQTVHGGHENKNGKLVFPVIAKCGSLKCPPYRHNQLIECAVCTK